MKIKKNLSFYNIYSRFQSPNVGCASRFFSMAAKQSVTTKSNKMFKRVVSFCGNSKNKNLYFSPLSVTAPSSILKNNSVFFDKSVLGNNWMSSNSAFSNSFWFRDSFSKIATIHFGKFSVPNFNKRVGSQYGALSGQRLSGIIYGSRARKLAKFSSLRVMQYNFREKALAPSRSWRHRVYSSVNWPESQQQALRYSTAKRAVGFFKSPRYTLFAKNREFTFNQQLAPFNKSSLPTGRSVLHSVGKVAIFVKPYMYRVRYELAKLKETAVSRNSSFGANFTPTIKRYLERLWRVRFRLRFERFFFRRVGSRTYVWLQSTFRGLRISYRKRFNRAVGIMQSEKNKAIAAHWRWSTYQMTIFYYAVFMMMTQPGNLELPFITLSRLMRKHREHFRVIRFFMGYIRRAMASRRVDNLFNFRLRVAGKFAGELKRRSMLVGSGEMRLARFKIPADFYTTQIVTKYGIFGVKFWVQVFPATEWADEIIEPAVIINPADDIRDDDPEYPGWVYFGKDELLGQWFMQAMYGALKDAKRGDTLEEALAIASETHLAPKQLATNLSRFEKLVQTSSKSLYISFCKLFFIVVQCQKEQNLKGTINISFAKHQQLSHWLKVLGILSLERLRQVVLQKSS